LAANSIILLFMLTSSVLIKMMMRLPSIGVCLNAILPSFAPVCQPRGSYSSGFFRPGSPLRITTTAARVMRNIATRPVDWVASPNQCSSPCIGGIDLSLTSNWYTRGTTTYRLFSSSSSCQYASKYPKEGSTYLGLTAPKNAQLAIHLYVL
jgi:hypothetical protein